jgi:hypothetical protein
MTQNATKPPLLIPIPAGSRPRPCRGETCTMRIYDAPHPKSGRMHPVSVDPVKDPRCCHPTSATEGRGISHFAVCPDAESFRARWRERAAREGVARDAARPTGRGRRA